MLTGLTLAIHWSVKSSFIITLAGTILAWSGYLKGHEIVTGQMVDHSSRFRENETHFSITGVIGVLLMFLAFPAGIISVNQGSFWLLMAGNSLFIGGYIIGHYGFTDKLL